MLADGEGDLVRLASRLGVVAAHDALLVRELDDGLAHEVRLGEVGSTRGGGGDVLAEARPEDDLGRQRLHACDLLAHGAELLLEDDLVQALDEVVHGNLEVLVIEELRVVETRPDDALVAVDDRLGDLGACVGDDDELAGERALRVIDGEVALVGEHGLADDLVGYLQELLVEGSHEHRRVLAQVHDLAVGALGRVDARSRPLGLNLLDALPDDLVASVGEKDAGGLERGLEARGVGDDVLAGAEDAMSPRRVRGGDVRVAHGDDLGAEKRADPADGTNEALVLAPPALRAVVRPLEPGNRRLGHLRENRHRGPRRDVLLGPDVLASVDVVPADERGGIDAELAGEARGSLGRQAIGAEGDGGGGATLDLANLLGGELDVAHANDEAPRSLRGTNLAVRETGLVEPRAHEVGDLLGRMYERCRRHLLGAYLEQKVPCVRHLCHPPFLACLICL